PHSSTCSVWPSPTANLSVRQGSISGYSSRMTPSPCLQLHRVIPGPPAFLAGGTRNDDRHFRWIASDLVTAMDRHDAGGKVPHLDIAETGDFHHRLQRLLVRMLADRFGEIAIAALVVRDELADARQHLERMEVVQRCKPGL